jgi:hypothetical protein
MGELLSLGKSDFAAIEAFCTDRFFHQPLGVKEVPGSVGWRQRREQLAPELREHTEELSVRLLQRAEAPISAWDGRLDFDPLVLDHSDPQKEAVSRTY